MSFLFYRANLYTPLIFKAKKKVRFLNRVSLFHNAWIKLTFSYQFARRCIAFLQQVIPFPVIFEILPYRYCGCKDHNCHLRTSISKDYKHPSSLKCYKKDIFLIYPILKSHLFIPQYLETQNWHFLIGEPWHKIETKGQLGKDTENDCFLFSSSFRSLSRTTRDDRVENDQEKG